MNAAWSVALAVLVPFLCLGMLLWMARLEETLTDGLAAPASGPQPGATAPDEGAPPASAAV